MLEQALRDRVPLCRREYDLRCASALEGVEGCVEQHSTDALPAMGGIDHDVVQHSRRPAQRHVIDALDASVGVSDHLAVSLGHEDDDVRLIELRAEKRAVPLLGEAAIFLAPGRTNFEKCPM